MGRYSDRWQENIDNNDKIGCCGNMVRFLLLIVNSLFLILGLTVFIAAAVLKWGNNDFSKFADLPYVDDIVKVGTIGTIAVTLMVIGGFIIVLSVIGIIGVKFLNKFFLVIFEIIICILFLSHGIAILVLLFGSSSIESDYKEAINKTVTNINEGTDYTKNAQFMQSLSGLFHCCGSKGPSDFKNSTILKDCCLEEKDTGKYWTEGCSDKSVQTIKDSSLNLLVIPSGIILVVELFSIIMVPCLIGKTRA
jgi:hypothetical protein